MLNKNVFLIILFFIPILGCTITTDISGYYKKQIIGQEMIQIPEKIPYTAKIEVDRTRKLSLLYDTDIIINKVYYPVGEMLYDAVDYYLKPMFTGEKEKDLVLEIGVYNIDKYISREGIFSEAECVRVDLKADIYIDGVIADWVKSVGRGCEKKGFSMTPEGILAAQKAFINAVKDLRKEIFERITFPEKSIASLNQYIKDNPDSVRAFVALANSLRIAKNYNEAITSARRAIEIAPQDVGGYMIAGYIHKELRQNKEAITFFKKALEINPKYENALSLLAQCYFDRGDFSIVVDTLKKTSINSRTAYYIAAQAYMGLGEYNESINWLNKAISLSSISGAGLTVAIEDNYPVVKELIEGPAKRAGIKAGDKIIKINGKSTAGWEIDKIIQNIRGTEGTQVILTIKRKDLDKPIEITIIREVITEKSAAPLFGLRSLAYRMKGNTEAAEKDAEKAYSLNPKDETTKEAVGAVYIDKWDYDSAIKILSNTSKDNYFARVLEATAYAKKGDYKKAVEIYSSIPDDYFVSKSVLRQNVINKFFESLNPYIKIREETAKSYEAKGQYKEALSEYGELLNILPEKNAKYIRIKIATIIKKAPDLSQIPDEARKYALRGEVMLKDGKFEEALKEFKRAIKMAPYIAVLYRTTALVYGELKDYDQAISYMNVYLDLMPDAPDTRAVKDQIYKWEFMQERERGEK